jgi:hypothetical protein
MGKFGNIELNFGDAFLEELKLPSAIAVRNINTASRVLTAAEIAYAQTVLLLPV